MSSKLFLLLGLSLAVSLLIASHVSGRELSEATVHAFSNTPEAVETKEHIDGSGKKCKVCCKHNFYGRCRKCCNVDVADIAAAAAAEP